jgi:hypothetical protein
MVEVHLAKGIAQNVALGGRWSIEVSFTDPDLLTILVGPI